jgi:cysteine synthase
MNALSLIGNTPLLALQSLSPEDCTIWAKAEFLNPGGSVKDRAALHIIESAYQNKLLRAGQPVVEMTSGNMGAGLAVVCAVKGNPLIVVMSRGNSPERVRMLTALGAQVILVDQIDGSPGRVTGQDIAAAEQQARQIAIERQGYYVDQFHNPWCVQAHQSTTGPELLAQLEGSIDAFVACVGSGGTLIGTSTHLKTINPKILCVAVQPSGAEVLNHQPLTKPQHLLQGTGYGSIPPHWRPSLIDHYLAVSDEEALETKQLLARKEGLHVGYSAAANVCAAQKLSRLGILGSKANIATVLCDTGLKYS